MHAYDVPRRPSFSSIPAARAAAESSGGSSATPIYDALYAEYVKSFRTLPGDRRGEEEFGFVAFGYLDHGGSGPGSCSSSYGAYSMGAYSTRHGGGQQSQWQRVGQLRPQGAGMHHVPALPPGPRRGI
ncbi:hypothetical protein AB0I98_42460 [Streptomyces sp. NPDC050211]|uniref:hypothetical protein n=1 Tax=Streptomyces sp. NPDC050211 TaxID=3154932 RepID=UPI00342841A3